MSEVSKNLAVWFEIPVTDLARAQEFYSKVLDTETHEMDMGPFKMAFFPHDNNVAGALVEGDGYIPGDKGPLIYLNGGEDLALPLSRVAAAGGKVLQEKMSLGPYGFMAIFLDTEGNRLALHSMK